MIKDGVLFRNFDFGFIDFERRPDSYRERNFLMG
jgi:hypothetical protein